MVKKKAANLLSKLTETEQELLSHIQDRYQLETDSLGGNPILRRLKDNEEIRPLSANRNTIKAMEQRGLISPGKGRDPLTIVWRLKKKINRNREVAAVRNAEQRSGTRAAVMGGREKPELNPANTLAPYCAAVVRFFGTGFCVTGIESDAGFTNPKFAASHKIPLHFNTHLGGLVPKFWDTRS